jgi:hypothetical protein
MHIELTINVLNLGPNCVNRDNQFMGDGGIGVSSGQEA